VKRGFVEEMEYDEVAILLGKQFPDRPIVVPLQQLPLQLLTIDRIEGLDIDRELLHLPPLQPPAPEL